MKNQLFEPFTVTAAQMVLHVNGHWIVGVECAKLPHNLVKELPTDVAAHLPPEFGRKGK